MEGKGFSVSARLTRSRVQHHIAWHSTTSNNAAHKNTSYPPPPQKSISILCPRLSTHKKGKEKNNLSLARMIPYLSYSALTLSPFTPPLPVQPTKAHFPSSSSSLYPIISIVPHPPTRPLHNHFHHTALIMSKCSFFLSFFFPPQKRRKERKGRHCPPPDFDQFA